MREKTIMGIRQPVWETLRGRFSRMAIGLHGYPLRIITLPKGSNTIGKTDHKKNVYLNPNHPLALELPEPEAVMFMMGVFAHEDMHQQMTDFELFKKATEEKPEIEQKVFHMICNIVEDPTIEYFASRFFGGKLLEALHFMVMYLYKQGRPLDKGRTASEQFFSAMIQYGDGGMLKGEFTFPEARKIFRKVLPHFDKAIESFDSKARLAHIEEIYKISRPLWIDEIEALNELMEALKKLGKDHSESSGSGDPDFKPEGGESKETKTEKRRKVTFRKISKEEAEEMKKNGEVSDKIPDEGDIEVLIVEGEESDESGKGAGMPGEEKSETDPSEDAEAPESSGKSEEKGEPDSSDDSGDSKTSGSAGESEAAESAGKPSGTAEGTDDSDEGCSISEEEFTISEERLREIVAEVATMLAEAETATIEQAEADGEFIEAPELSKRFKKVNCKNYHVSMREPEFVASSYAEIVNRLAGSISILTNQFKRIFRADIEERERRTSGRLNIKRLTSGTPSARVFDRKRLPGNKQDTAVVLLIDESGSMRGPKTKVAQQAAILLSEVFAKVGVTIKVVGFTDSGGSPEHFHYVSWKNTQKDRLKLLNITARRDNYDGYSIRYCGELLKKRPESHKMLIVVSDGLPATRAYKTYEQGFTDTRNAVREVSQIAKVFGVLIGSSDAGVHHTMYGNNFLNICNINDLPQRLAKKISTVIKEW